MRTDLQDSDGLIQHRLGVRVVVGGGEGQLTKVALKQDVGLGVGRVVGVGVHLQGHLLSQLTVQGKNETQ